MSDFNHKRIENSVFWVLLSSQFYLDMPADFCMFLFDVIFKLHPAGKSSVAPDAGFHPTTRYFVGESSSAFNLKGIAIGK